MVTVLTVQKRDGSQEEFSAKKLAAGIQKALQASQAKKQDPSAAAVLAERAHVQLVRVFTNLMPRTQDIHDITFETLKKAGLPKAAAAFEKSRQERVASQKFRTVLGVRDELGLTPRAITALSHNYLMCNDQGVVIETPGQMCRRVAKAIVQAEPSGAHAKKLEEHFFNIIATRQFLPSSTVLANAGISNQLLPNVMLPLQDSLESIFTTLGQMAQLMRGGTVVCLSFDALRHRGAPIKGNKGYATGAVSFLALFDAAADTIVESNRRKVANMAVLRMDHPDIEEFVAFEPRNFKKGVLLTDAFMKAVTENGEWPLLDASKKEVKRINASALFETLIAALQVKGDPALIFVDHVTAERPLATTPCPSQPLLANESCMQGVINLAVMVDRNHVAWERLRQSVQLAVRFLDDCIDVTAYPTPAIELAVKAHRKIGIGVMGYAEMLLQLGMQYGSKKALDTADKVMKFISDEARKESVVIGKAKGSYPALAQPKRPQRNATLTTISATGALSLLGPASSGIEPLTVLVSTDRRVVEMHPLLERILRERGVYSPALALKIGKSGGQIADVPRDLRTLLSTLLPVEAHLRTQEAFQKHVDNGVCKALQCAPGAKPADLRKAILLGRKLRLKSLWFHAALAVPCRGCGV